MRAAISLLVLLLSMCGVQTESHGTDSSTQDVSTELKELRDMVVESMGWRATLRHTRDEAMKQRLVASESKVEVLEADNVAMKQRLAVSETKVEALERAVRALQDTKAEMKMEMNNLKKENVAVKTALQHQAASKVAFSAGLRGSGAGFTEAGSNNLNLVFKRVITNVGEAYSSTTGYFKAPVRGVYYFRFTVLDELDSRYMFILMYKNGVQLMQLWESDTDGKPSYLSSGLALQLEKGDTVNMVLPARYRLYDDSDYKYSTFSGFLLFPL